VGREDCTSRCADAWVSSGAKASDSGRRRVEHRWKARSNRDAALFHHTAAAMILDGRWKDLALGALPAQRDGASEARCLAVSTAQTPAEASATG
jgi:hypothetical protein